MKVPYSMRPAKLKYKSITGRVDVELPIESEHDLLQIRLALQREGLTPDREVSKATAVRRALAVYARSLSANTGHLFAEAERATMNTYRK